MYSCLRFDILLYSQLQLMRSTTKSSDAKWRLLEARNDMINNVICRMNVGVIGSPAHDTTVLCHGLGCYATLNIEKVRLGIINRLAIDLVMSKNACKEYFTLMGHPFYTFIEHPSYNRVKINEPWECNPKQKKNPDHESDDGRLEDDKMKSNQIDNESLREFVWT